MRVSQLINDKPSFTLSRLLVATELVIPLLYFYLAYARGGGDIFSKAISGSVVGFLLVFYALSSPILFPKNLVSFSLLALGFLNLLSAIYALSPYRSINAGFTAFLFLTNYVLLYNYLAHNGNIIRLLRNIIIGGLIIVGFGFRYLLMSKARIIPQTHEMVTYFIGRFFWKNPMASYLALLLPVSLFLFLHDKNKLFRILYALFFVTGGAGFLLTGSRGAWLSLVIAVIATTVIFFKRISPKLAISALALTILAFALTTAFSSPLKLIKRAGTVTAFVSQQKPLEGSFNERLDLYQSAVRIFLKYPFSGAGADCFSLAYPQFMRRSRFASQYTHNQFLQQAAELGIFGFLIFLLFSLSAVVQIAKNKDNPLSLFAFLGSAFFVVHLCFDIDWYITVLPLLFLTHIAIVTQKQDIRIRPWITYLSAAVMILYFTLTTLGESLYSSARYDYLKGRKDEAMRELKLASIFVPLKSEIYQAIGDLVSDKGETEEATLFYKRAIRLEKTSSDSYIRIARNLVMREKYEEAIPYYQKAIAYSRLLRPQFYNEFGRLLSKLKRHNEAKALFDTVANQFGWGADWHYNERTVANRYYVADALYELAGLESDTTKAKEYILKADSLGSPRKYDEIAKTFGDNFLAPEYVVKEFYEAWSSGDTAKARSLLVEKNYTMCPIKETAFKILRILDVYYDYWAGMSEVRYLLEAKSHNKTQLMMGRLRLYRTETGWKIDPSE